MDVNEMQMIKVVLSKDGTHHYQNYKFWVPVVITSVVNSISSHLIEHEDVASKPNKKMGAITKGQSIATNCSRIQNCFTSI